MITDVTILSGEQKSDPIKFNNRNPRFLIVPSDFDGTEITAEVKFRQTWSTVCKVDTTEQWRAVVDTGRSQPSCIPVKVESFLGLEQVRFISNAEETADREILVVVM